MRRRIRKLRDTAKVLPWLLLARFARRPQHDPPDDLNGKKILVIQWNAIGDALMTTPLLSSLKSRFPHAGIDVLATEVNRPIFDCRADVGTVYAFRSTT